MKFIYSKPPKKVAKMPCQNCGKMVNVMVPFYGCIFCSECMKGESYETADAAEFKRYVIE